MTDFSSDDETTEPQDVSDLAQRCNETLTYLQGFADGIRFAAERFDAEVAK